MRSAVALSALAFTLGLTVACSSPSAKGTLTDGMTGEPIPEMRIVATAVGTTSMTCAAFEATTDANGAFEFKGLCSGSAYDLKTANENLWLAETDQIPDGGAESLPLKVWRAPKGAGLYRLSGGELNAIKTTADIKSEPVWNHETEKVTYPSTLPKAPVLIGADDHLVLVGEGAVTQTQFHPLIASGERKFGSDKTTKVTMQPWSYIGVEFRSDTDYDRKTAAPDATKVLNKQKGDRNVSWVKGDALPAGRYAVHKEKDQRTTVLDFGAAPQ